MIANIIMFLFIIPIIAGIFLLKRSRKLAHILISLPFIGMLITVGLWLYQVNHQFVGNTDLQGERFSDVALLEILDEERKDAFGEFEELESLQYDEWLAFEHLIIGVNEQKEIIYIHTDDTNQTTEKGIKIGDTIEQVKSTYGENHYNLKEKEYGESLNYVDRDAKIHIQFWHDGKQVTSMRLISL